MPTYVRISEGRAVNKYFLNEHTVSHKSHFIVCFRLAKTKLPEGRVCPLCLEYLHQASCGRHAKRLPLVTPKADTTEGGGKTGPGSRGPALLFGQDCEQRRGRSTGSWCVTGDRDSVWEGETFWRWMVVAVAQKRECTRCHQSVHLKWLKQGRREGGLSQLNIRPWLRS